MVATYSPQRDAGGILHLPSPAHVHQIDTPSALRQLRHSLSQSPSRGSTYRLVTSKSTSLSPRSPLSPPPLSPQKRQGSINLISSINVTSPLAIPFPPSAKKYRSSARRTSPMRTISRSSSGPRSPMKRGLSDSTDFGNAIPPSPSEPMAGPENRTPGSLSPVDKVVPDGALSSFISGGSDTRLAPHHALTRLDHKGNGFLSRFAAKSSPLKRSDGIMNLDQASLGSPSAKRRSLHGATFSPDFDIFDHEAALLVQGEISNGGDLARFESQNSSDQLSAFCSLPRRTSSLRKTTLQQRHEKPSFVKSRPNTDLALDFTNPGQGVPKGRQRMSLENFMQPLSRDSRFSSQGSLPSASLHPIGHEQKEQQTSEVQPQPPRHPLSRTLTQSSSNSIMAEDSPTHIPIRLPDYRRQVGDFSRSLPVGAMRPETRQPMSHETSEYGSSTNTSFATPENYKLTKPLPAAFMSTGLISKRTRLMDHTETEFRDSTTHMPDTPCKRPHSLVAVDPIPTSNGADSQARHGRHSLHSFGTPSTPFNPHAGPSTTGAFGKGVNIFGSGFASGSITRRGSFVSNDGDEVSQSPSRKEYSQSNIDLGYPPTPTKQAPVNGEATMTNLRSEEMSMYSLEAVASTSAASGSLGAETYNKAQFRKLSPRGTPSGSVDGDSDSVMEDSPSAAMRFRSFSSITSFSSRSHLSQKPQSPTPLSKRSHSVPFLLRSRNMKTKPSLLSPASPLSNRCLQLSPRTPQETMLPPDPSGLSISAQGNGPTFQSLNEAASSASVPSPATPTGPKDNYAAFGRSQSSITPVHDSAPSNVDQYLISRFDTVEVIGTGEFSLVYRVAKTSNPTCGQGYFSVPTSLASPKTPLPDRVWAVKKSRNPYVGVKDRRSKLQEVEVLKTLGQSDHTVQLVDSWEYKDHLYIQTEFCEEGSLAEFLTRVGRESRLDDFRIWKIMLELCLGLKHIHDHGFIHLDLKPANVLITFEGVLKIADFGIATTWPAQPGIDGEGDREYIGPEILIGQYDKPADVFALGLIMFEIAGNVRLPDNGASWQRLRSGDMSDVPSLTWSSEPSNVFRDSSGNPLSNEESLEDLCGSDYGGDGLESLKLVRAMQIPKKPIPPRFHFSRSGELANPPSFMTDPNNENALDTVVKWMISPVPEDRPVVDQILGTVGVQWAKSRSRAGATIFEGNWGPADEVLADDLEMIDV